MKTKGPNRHAEERGGGRWPPASVLRAARCRAVKLWQECLHRFVPMPLTPSQILFMQENNKFWSRYSPPEEVDGYVYIETTGHDVIDLCNASFGMIVAQAKGVKPLFAIRDTVKTPVKQILETYPQAEFVYLAGWPFRLSKLRAAWKAYRVFRSLKTPGDILELRVDDIVIGNVIYDAVLSYGYATIHRIDGKVLRALVSIYLTRDAIKRILHVYPIKIAVLSQLMGPKGSIIAKHIIREGIEILNRVGSHQLLIKKYRTMDDSTRHPTSPIPEYFSLMMENDDGTVERAADEYLEKRLTGGVGRIDAALAFNPEKKLYTSPESFYKDYDLDDRKPLVFVMLHAFNDNPHWSYPRRMLFTDYYHLFMKTLDIARNVKEVNWIFKEHPTQRYYPTKDIDLNGIMSRVACEHIRFLDAEADFNTSSLRYIAHAIVTGTGTAGLEFSAYGIPCVLTTEGRYGGHGFTIEPPNVEEFCNYLKQIRALKPLNAGQIRAAKVMTYFLYSIMENTTYYFCPHVGARCILKDWRGGALWDKAGRQFLQPEHVKKMKEQVEQITRFVLDDMRIQYVDLDRYAFLREGCKEGRK